MTTPNEADLRAELGDLPEAQAEMLTEIKQLRAQLAELAATEPVAWFFTDTQSGDQEADTDPDSYTREVATGYKRKQPLFTHPMPAQGVEASMIKLPEPVELNPAANSVMGHSDATLKQAVRDALDAQGVTELVGALEMIVSTHQGHCEHHVGVSKHSYNLADIAEEALSKYKGAK